MSDSITTVGQTRPDDALQVSGAAAAELLCIQAADDVFSSAQDRQALSELLLQVLTSLWCNYGHYCSEVTLLPRISSNRCGVNACVQSPSTVIATTRRGGHCGFFHSYSAKRRASFIRQFASVCVKEMAALSVCVHRWADEAAIEFLRAASPALHHH
jgi:hypothetical protein